MSPGRSLVRLHWQDLASPPLAADVALEVVRPGDSSCRLITGDNLQALGAWTKRAGERFAFAYLDPPFLTGRQHHRVTRSRGRSGGVVRSVHPAFDDRWAGLDAYLSALKARLVAIRALLVPEGSAIVHVDPKTSHYVKVLCDEIFGPQCFASEIIWHYRRWPAKTRNFQRMHDVLLRYVRDSEVEPRFCQLYEPLAASTLATWGDRKQRAVVAANGRRTRSSKTDEPTPGTPLGDVWNIGIIAPVARERTGYPTQKPEALLERLIEACTQPGDLVLDPYAGSGTTLAVALRKGRRVVGIDSNPDAIAIARNRLEASGARPLEERVRPPTAIAV